MSMPLVADEQLNLFCRRWAIAELSLFGAALREDFGPESDVDILVAFLPEAQWSLLDHVQMEMELAELLGREVDLITRRIGRGTIWALVVSTTRPYKSPSSRRICSASATNSTRVTGFCPSGV